MRFFAGAIFGFIGGTFYALYQTVKVPDGLAVNIMEKIKLILEVF